MNLLDSAIEAIVLTGAFAGYLHFTRGAGGKPAAADLVEEFRTVAGQLPKDIGDHLAKLPAIVSSEVARLEGELSAALQRADGAEASLKAEQTGRLSDWEGFKAKVAAAVGVPVVIRVPATPPAEPIAPAAVAGAAAEPPTAAAPEGA